MFTIFDYRSVYVQKSKKSQIIITGFWVIAVDW